MSQNMWTYLFHLKNENFTILKILTWFEKIFHKIKNLWHETIFSIFTDKLFATNNIEELINNIKPYLLESDKIYKVEFINIKKFLKHCLHRKVSNKNEETVSLWV